MSDTFRTHDGRTLQQAASDLVQREVLCCMSSMVATLGNDHAGLYGSSVRNPLVTLCEQAVELCAPVLDYEGAAREAGWAQEGATWNHADYNHSHPTADLVCDWENIEPHELEVYEHWAVSTWLAEKLQAAGERVDTDFAGLNVWARTTTGQAISIDAVIEQITREMHTAHDDAIDAISRHLVV